MRRLKRIVLWVLALLTIFITMFYLLQEKLIFLPTTLAQNHQFAFEAPFEEIFLDAPDGARLNALHFKLENPKGLILYFHGNAGDLSRWGKIVIPLVDSGYEVVVMDYRTYGKSTGRLSENAIHADAQLFYDYAKQNFPEDKILIFGRSLGASIATRVASKNSPKKLILETPFYNLMDVAQVRFPFLPLKRLLKYRFSSNEYIQNVASPIRIFHGTSDEVVAYASGKKLFDAIPIEDKRFYTINNGEHNNLIEFKSYREALAEELK